MGDLIKAKLQAMGIHFAISVVVFLGIVYLIMVQWYPGALIEAEGGWKGLKLMAIVDLVLGPSLTFIIFNNKKSVKEITFDLTIVAIIQISALVWGGMQVYAERPIALVMWEGKFYTVTDDYYEKQNVTANDLSVYSDESPLLIYAEEDHSLKQLKETQQLNKMKIPSYAQAHLYSSLKENIDKVLKYRLSNTLLSLYMQPDEIEAGRYVFLGKAKYSNLLIILDANTNLVKITTLQK